MPTQKTPAALEITDEDTAALQNDEEKIVAEAKASFSLEHRLQGVKLATAKVLVFTDLDAAAVWARQDEKTQRLASLVSATDPGSEQYDEAVQAHDEADTELEVVRDAAFASALAIHMRALPQVAFEVAKRKAMKIHADDSGEIPDSAQEAYYETQNEILLGQVVTRIVDATGAEAEFERAKIAKQLQSSLGVAQFARVMTAFNALMFNDTLARAATADPGF